MLVLNDIVIDTNVLEHADSGVPGAGKDAITFLQALLSKSTALRVDPGFSSDRSRNQSLIVGEYFQRLLPIGFSATVLQILFSSGRVKACPRRAPAPVEKRIRAMVRNKRDRTFLNVAHNSSERLLVSHDRTDFHPSKRTTIRRTTGVRIEEASGVVALL